MELVLGTQHSNEHDFVPSWKIAVVTLQDAVSSRVDLLYIRTGLKACDKI
jgi:hypothetical protein